MKCLKSILSLIAVAALTMTSTAFASQPGGASFGGGEESPVYQDQLDTKKLFELPEDIQEKPYTGYTIFPDSILMIEDGGRFYLAYCYNHGKAAPEWVTGTEYTGKEGFFGQGHGEDEAVIKKRVEALLYVGYPYDAAGYRAVYGGLLADDTPIKPSTPTEETADDSAKSGTVTKETAEAIANQGYQFTLGDFWAAYATQKVLWEITEGPLSSGSEERTTYLQELREQAKGADDVAAYARYQLALYDYAMKGEVPQTTQLVFRGLDTDRGEFSEITLKSVDGEDYYESNPIVCQSYSGTVTLDLPEGFEAYVIDALGVPAAEAATSISTTDRFVLRCTSDTAAKDFNDGKPLQFKGSYTYKTVGKFFIYTPADAKYQNLFTFTEKGDTTDGIFQIAKGSGGSDDTTSSETTSSETTSSETTSSETTSSETTSSETTSSETTSSETTSSETTSSETTSSETTSSETTSSETTSSETTSSETTSSETTSSETTSSETTPSETTSSETTSSETTSSETTSSETTSSETTSSETTSSEPVIPDRRVPVVEGGTVFNPPVGDETVDFPQETVAIDEPDVPLASAPQELAEIAEDDVPLANIPDEDVPLSGEPQTGDNSGVAARLLALSLIGMAVFAGVMLWLSRKEDAENQD